MEEGEREGGVGEGEGSKSGKAEGREEWVGMKGLAEGWEEEREVDWEVERGRGDGDGEGPRERRWWIGRE